MTLISERVWEQKWAEKGRFFRVFPAFFFCSENDRFGGRREIKDRVLFLNQFIYFGFGDDLAHAVLWHTTVNGLGLPDVGAEPTGIGSDTNLHGVAVIHIVTPLFHQGRCHYLTLFTGDKGKIQKRKNPPDRRKTDCQEAEKSTYGSWCASIQF